jgi:ubiquinone biosynthesis protein COQ9
MRKNNDTIKDAILESALPDVPFDGWTMDVLERAAQAAGYEAAMVYSVFPAGVKDAIVHLSRWADRQMLERLSASKNPPARIRDKVTLAVRTRLEVLAPHKEAERLAIAYWLRPLRKWEGAKLVWKTADTIWDWAGDTATDYNRYTKRGLLSGVLTATTLFWLSDNSKGSQDSWAFLDRRIENVMSVGKIVGKLKTA